MSDSKNKKGFFRNFSVLSVYSQVAGLAAMTATNFLEVTKIRLITDVNKCSTTHYTQKTLLTTFKNRMQGITVNNLKQKCVDCLPVRNTFFTMHHIVRNEGLNVFLFSGLNKTMASHFIRVGLFYPIFEMVKSRSKFLFPEEKKELYSSMVGSGISRSIVTLISFPFEVTKIVSQTKLDNKKKAKLLYTLKAIRKEPYKFSTIFLNFFQREMFFSLLFWWILEKTRKRLNEENYSWADSDFKAKIVGAAVGGFVASCCTFPYDIIQTNKIIHKFPDNLGSIGLIKHLKSKYGWSFLINGMFVRVVRGSTITGIFFSIYELLKSYDGIKEY